MFKSVGSQVWIFDTEWVPDPITGKLLYQLSDELSDEAIMLEMWKKGGATEDNPTPYLKTVLCRVVSISAITRTLVDGEVRLRLLSLPRDPHDSKQTSESQIIESFLNAIGKFKPQLVGYNSVSADLKIMIQR
ncbi:hypothetical protein KKA14_07625, partial [bacterium]|nr:hypothetical protein [bacterium]